jgi:hypothetical protein
MRGMKDLKNEGEKTIDDDLGFMFWKLESIENFFPCYKSMIKQE